MSQLQGAVRQAFNLSIDEVQFISDCRKLHSAEFAGVHEAVHELLEERDCAKQRLEQKYTQWLAQQGRAAP